MAFSSHTRYFQPEPPISGFHFEIIEILEFYILSDFSLFFLNMFSSLVVRELPRLLLDEKKYYSDSFHSAYKCMQTTM